jgi:NADPH:quinone reductase-like Zn-dependent oxidoreductase
LAHVPDDVPSVIAAGIGLAGATALDVIDAAAVEAGGIVLISGATGGVGVFAVQLAAARGARVIATATPGPAADELRRLGATDIVDHTADLAAQVRAIAPAGVQSLVHAAGDVNALADLVAPQGTIASLTVADLSAVRPGEIATVSVQSRPTADKLQLLLDDVAAGRLAPHVAATFPLEDAAQAMAAFASGAHLGKIVVEVGKR